MTAQDTHSLLECEPHAHRAILRLHEDERRGFLSLDRGRGATGIKRARHTRTGTRRDRDTRVAAALRTSRTCPDHGRFGWERARWQRGRCGRWRAQCSHLSGRCGGRAGRVRRRVWPGAPRRRARTGTCRRPTSGWRSWAIATSSPTTGTGRCSRTTRSTCRMRRARPSSTASRSGRCSTRRSRPWFRRGATRARARTSGCGTPSRTRSSRASRLRACARSGIAAGAPAR